MISAHDPTDKYQVLLEKISLTGPFSLQEFCEALSAKRVEELGRPLIAVPYAFPPAEELGEEISGLWIATLDTDYIFYEQNADPLVQKQIVFHEASHMIEGHEPIDAATAMNRLFEGSGISPELVRHMYRRTNFSDREEAEAEHGGTLLLAASARPRTIRADASAKEAAALDSFQQIFSAAERRPRRRGPRLGRRSPR